MKNNKVNTIINEVKGRSTFSDNIVFVFVILILGIDFMPYFKSLEIINPQFLYLSLLNLFFGVYLYWNQILISDSILISLKKSCLSRLYLAFLFFCALSIFFAKNTSLVLTRLTEIVIVFCLFINLAILLKDKLNLLYKIAFIVSISAFFQSWKELHHFVIIAKDASVKILLEKMVGNTGNINILAASLTIKIPFILIALLHFKNYKKLFLIVTLLSAISVIFLTAARAALLNLFLLFIVNTAYIFKENSFTKSSFYKIFCFGLPMLLAFFFSNSVFEKAKDNSRYVSLENRISKINADDQSSQARLVFWKNALQMTKKSHFMGIGLGNYQVESIPYERETANETNVSLHAHNDFIEILTETGIINGLIYLSIFIYILIVNAKRIIWSSDKGQREIAILALLLLIVYGVDSFFNFPMYRPTMSVFFCFLLAFTLVNTRRKELFEKREVLTLKISTVSLIVIAIITSFSAFTIYKASNLEYLITADDINQNDKGHLTGDEVIRRMPLFPNVFSSSESFYEYAGIYYIREKNYKKALNCFSKASKINPYFGRIDFYKYVISNQKGEIDSAYVYSKKAFYTRPRNMDLFKAAINIGTIKKDTTEILKEHNLFIKYRNIPEAWNNTASKLRYSGYNYKSLIHFLNQGLKTLPKDTLLLNKRNDLLITDYLVKGQKNEALGKKEEALKCYQDALKISPTNIYAMQNIGFYYFSLNENKKAIKYFLNALKYPGLDNGKTEFFLAYCYLKENDQQNACRYFNISKNKKFISVNLKLFQNCAL